MEVKFDRQPSNSVELTYIFIHGINGSVSTTWGDMHSENSWVNQLCQPPYNARILAINHNFNTFQLEPTKRNLLIENSADEFSKKWDDLEITSPVIFVCHSLGGIIFKKFLIRFLLKRGYNSLSVAGKEFKRAVFLATPHTGSKLAHSTSRFIPKIIHTTAFRDLKVGSRVMRSINLDFVDLLTQFHSNMKVDVFAEQRGISISEVPGVRSLLPSRLSQTIRLPIMVVNNQEATTGYSAENFYTVDESHSLMAQLNRKSALPILNHLKQCYTEDRNIISIPNDYLQSN